MIGTFLIATGTAVAFLVHLLRLPRVNLREALEDRISIESALESRIGVLESHIKDKDAEILRVTALAEDSRRDSFNNSVLLEKYKEENKRMGVKILDLLEEVDGLRRLVAEHERAAESARREEVGRGSA